MAHMPNYGIRVFFFCTACWPICAVGQTPVGPAIASSLELNLVPRKATPFPLRIELHNLKRTRDDAAVEVSFTNVSDTIIEVYNIKLGRLLLWKQGYTLGVRSEDGTYLGDSLYMDGGSSRAPGLGDWVKLPPGATRTTVFGFRVGYVGEPGSPSKNLAPGKYYLELIANAPALAGKPSFVTASEDGSRDVNHPSYREWTKRFPGPEICRSNRVELEILPRTGD